MSFFDWLIVVFISVSYWNTYLSLKSSSFSISFSLTLSLSHSLSLARALHLVVSLLFPSFLPLLLLKLSLSICLSHSLILYLIFPLGLLSQLWSLYPRSRNLLRSTKMPRACTYFCCTVIFYGLFIYNFFSLINDRNRSF